MIFTAILISFLGLVSSEKSSASYIVSRPGGGHVAVVAVGGAPESLDSRPGALTLQMLSRKGFIKLALKHGYGTATAERACVRASLALC